MERKFTRFLRDSFLGGTPHDALGVHYKDLAHINSRFCLLDSAWSGVLKNEGLVFIKKRASHI